MRGGRNSLLPCIGASRQMGHANAGAVVLNRTIFGRIAVSSNLIDLSQIIVNLGLPAWSFRLVDVDHLGTNGEIQVSW